MRRNRSRHLITTFACALALVAGLAACRPAPGGLSGHITVTSGPSAGVRISVFSDVSETLVAETWTDADGTYRTALAPGRHRVRIGDSYWWNGAGSWESAQVVVVGDDGAVVDVALAEVETGVITGHVEVWGQADPTGVIVTATNASTRVDIASTTSAGDGTYSLTVPTGSYKVRFDMADRPTSWSGSASSFASAPTVAVTADATTATVDGAIEYAKTLHVQVTGPQDTLYGAQGALVFALHATDNEVMAQDTTDALGRATLEPLARRPHRILVVPGPSEGLGIGLLASPYILNGSEMVSLEGADCPGSLPATAPPDQSGKSLAGCRIEQAAGKDFTGADLRWADFPSSSATTGATFDEADLTASRFFTLIDQASMQGADLRGAFLLYGATGSDFSGATLDGATMVGRWDDVHLSGASLAGASTSFSAGPAGSLHLEGGSGIVGTPASMPTGWSLREGYLFGRTASYTGDDMSGFDLSGVNLSYVSFDEVDLTGADLSGVNLTGTSLATSTLTGVVSVGIEGTPWSLPPGWSLVDGTLIGP